MCIDYMYGTVVPNDFEEFKNYCIDNHVECVIVSNNKVLIESYGMSMKTLTHIKNMCSYVDVQYDTEEFETFRESKDTGEQAVELFPSDLFYALQKYAIKKSEIEEILERIAL